MNYLIELSSILCGFYEKPIRDGLAPNQVFNAVPLPPFSAAAELASLRHPRRPTSSGPLEGQRRCAATSLGNPRGYAPLVAGRFEASEKGRRERREIGATVGRGNVAFPLQGVRRRLNLQWTLRLFRICVLNSSLHILLATQIGTMSFKRMIKHERMKWKGENL